MAIAFYHGTDAGNEAAAALQGTLHIYADFPVLLLLSGGSWFNLLERIELTKMNDLAVSVLDERYSTNPLVNNFAQLTGTNLWQQIEEQSHKTIDMRVREGETHEHHAGRFQTELRAWRMLYPEGVVIATMGMGEDGHTAGILPKVFDSDMFAQTFEDPNHVVAHYDATSSGNQFPLRTTTTFPFLRDYVNIAITYASGEKKEGVVKALKQDEGSLEAMPARIMREMKHVQVFTDVPG